MKAVSIFATLTALLFLHSPASSQSNAKTKALQALPSPAGVLSNGERGLMNINNMSAWFRRDGWSGRNPTTGNSGTVYPRGTATAVFQDGIVWGGKVNDTRNPAWPQKRVGGCTYYAGTMPGWIVIPGTPTSFPVAIDPNNPRARIYKIRRDYQSLTTNDPEIIQEAAEFNNVAIGQVTQQMASAIIDQYVQDWNQWPGDLGAPFYDLNANGTWDPGIDKPGLQNADQVMWFVTNDVDSVATRALYGAPPLGLEVQFTFWAYKADGVFGQTMYRRTRIINKSGFPIDSMYVAEWSDSDIGDSGNDLAGCDTVLNSSFVYNGRSHDFAYDRFDLPPAAIGYTLLQGPLIPTGNTQDTAVFDFRRISGAVNQRMTASIGVAYQPATVYEPEFGNYRGTLQWFNWFVGRFIFGGEFVYPPFPGATKFWLDGDPLSHTGRIDGVMDPPGGREITLNTGPFSMANGDTQEVVIALVGGIRPTGDNLTSFAQMKENIIQLRSFYGRQFDVPVITKRKLYPTDTTTQLVVRADLRTQTGVTGSQIVFSPEVGNQPGFTIQLYDDGLHQDSLAGDGIWGNSVVKRNQKFSFKGDLDVQSASGTLMFGGLYSNIALRPKPELINFRVVWENGRQDSALNNNETIHFAFDLRNPDGVNAIDTIRIMNLSSGGNNQLIVYNQSIPPRGIVSDPSFYLVLQGPATGSTFEFRADARFDHISDSFAASLPVVSWNPGTHWGDTLSVSALRGVTYNVKPVIADPTALTGHTYIISFFRSVVDTEWRLYDQTLGQLKYDNGIISAEAQYPHPVIDGVQYRVSTSVAGASDFRCVADANGLRPDSLSQAAFLFNGSGFPSTLGPVRPPFDRPQPNAGGAAWGIHTGGSGGGDESYLGRFVPRVFRNDNFSRFVPYDFEIRFTPSGGKAWLAFTSGNVINVPFELWNIGISTPNDPSDDSRMIPWINDVDGNGAFGIVGIDHAISGGDDDPMIDWIYWYDPDPHAPGTAGYDAFVAAGSSYDGSQGTGYEVMGRMVLVSLNGGSVSDPNFPNNLLQQVPETGMVFRIISTKANLPGDSLVIVATPTSVPLGEVPVSIYLDQNYPNPFNPVTTIRFGLTSQARVELFIYNILGQKVRTILNEDMSRGNHIINWNSQNDAGSTVGSGVYFYRLKVGGFVQTRKMMLLR